MRKTLFTAIFLSAIFFAKAQNNTLLQADFWKSNPTLETVKSEISKGNSPSEQNGGFHDPVTMAINNRISNDVIQFLIEQEGNDVHKKTHHSRSYLQWAAAAGNLEIVKFLIDQGSDVHYKDSYGTPVIAYAASAGNTNSAVYDLLFDKGVKSNILSEEGTNLIMYAIANDKDLKLTDYFISKGVSISHKDNYGRTVADYAAKLGNLEIIDQLIKRGIHPTDQALFFASQGSRRVQNGLEVYQTLVEKYHLNPKALDPKGQTILHELVRRPNMDIIHYFLNQGVKPTIADKENNTVLMNAAAGGNLEVVQVLLNHNLDINLKNNNNESALTKAVALGNSEVVELLLKHGADVHILDKQGNSLAAYLVQSFRLSRNESSILASDFYKKLQVLKAAGLDFSKTQANGQTILHLATDKNNVELLKLMASLGVDINAQDLDGNTALHQAALTAKDDKVLKALVELGIDKNLTTEFEETAYDLASQNEFLSNNTISIDFLK